MAKSKENDKEELTIEQRFTKLDEIVNALEDENVTLEQSFELYKQGMDYLKACSDELGTVEKKVLQLREDGGTDEF